MAIRGHLKLGMLTYGHGTMYSIRRERVTAMMHIESLHRIQPS
jgi:hypothetical protein